MGKKSQARRANGEGTLYQTKSGLWRRAVMYTDPVTGKPVRKYVQHMKRSVAEKKFADLRNQLHLSQSPDAGAQPLADYLDGWLQAKRVSVKPSTWRHYEVAVRVHLKPRLGHVRLGRLNALDVERVTSDLGGWCLSPRRPS